MNSSNVSGGLPPPPGAVTYCTWKKTEAEAIGWFTVGLFQIK